MEQITAFQNKEVTVDHQLKDFILFLNNSPKTIINKNTLDETVVNISQSLTSVELVHEFRKIDDEKLSRLEKLDKIEVLLSNNFIDTKIAKSFNYKRYLEFVLQCAIGIVMLTLGLAMIILPAPAYFEMFTIFHFNDHDGFTLMDLISLIIVLTGVFLMIKSYFKLVENS
jgi:hypothetical protein